MFSRVPSRYIYLIVGPVFFVLGILSLVTGYFPSRTSQPLSPEEARVGGTLLTLGSGTISLVLLRLALIRKQVK